MERKLNDAILRSGNITGIENCLDEINKNNISIDYNPILCKLVDFGDVEIIKLMLFYGAKIDNRLIARAKNNNDYKMVKFLKSMTNFNFVMKNNKIYLL
jgi:hypothetical protein